MYNYTLHTSKTLKTLKFLILNVEKIEQNTQIYGQRTDS